MSAWDELVRLLPEFRTAVLTAIDERGYPFSVRCRPQPDTGAQVLRVDVPPGVPLQAGPASLLCHTHDERLWHQRSFLVRGTLARDAQGWHFRPGRFIPGLGLGGIKGAVQFAREARRTAGRYLAARGLPRPSIPWAEINAVKAEAKRASRAGKSAR